MSSAAVRDLRELTRAVHAALVVLDGAVTAAEVSDATRRAAARVARLPGWLAAEAAALLLVEIDRCAHLGQRSSPELERARTALARALAFEGLTAGGRGPDDHGVVPTASTTGTHRCAACPWDEGAARPGP